MHGNRIIRMTFSRSLAELLARQDASLSLRRFRIVLDQKLAPGERSLSGLYALVSRETGIILRVSLIQGIAEMHRDPASRDIYSAWIGAEAPVN
jgi:hypothetical protein